MNFLSNINLNKNELQNAVMHPLASAPSSPKAGQIYFNSIEKEMYQYDGTQWKKFGSDSIDWSKITNIPEDLVFDDNYVHTDNNYTTTEKNKLAGIQNGAEVNVQADWNETSSSSDAYIKNKPTIPNVPVYTIEEVSATSGYLKTYQLKKDSAYVGAKINIPKDMVVSSGSVKTVTQTDVPYSGAVIGDKYIDLVIANATSSHIYIPVKDLVDVYTAGTSISVSDSNVISVISDTALSSTSVNPVQNKVINTALDSKINNNKINNNETGDVLWTAEKILEEIENAKQVGYQYSGEVENNQVINMQIPAISDYKTPNVEVLVYIDNVWQKAIHGIDYVYAFTSSTNLRVTFFNGGQYKVNYFFMASGSFPNFITSDEQPSMQNPGDYWFEIL